MESTPRRLQTLSNHIIACPTEGKSAADVVTAMVKEWDNPDVAKISASLDNHFTQDAVWHMDPSSRPRVGLDAIKKAVDGMSKAGMVPKGWVVKSQVSMGDTVMNERIDKFETKGKMQNFPCMGVFKVRDGKICEWRDYLDNGDASKAKEGSIVATAK